MYADRLESESGSKKLVKDRITVYSGEDKSTRSLREGSNLFLNSIEI